MNKIGFKNFRRFINFQPIEYHNITFLVGRNNSGKSTIVKALLLVLEYLKSNDVSKFSFANKSLEDANIVTYERAKNKFANEDFIKFEFTLGQFKFDITITGKNSLTIVDVDTLIVTDLKQHFSFLIRPQLKTIKISKSGESKEAAEDIDANQLASLEQIIESFEEELKSTDQKKSSKEYILKMEELRNLKRRRNILAHSSTNIEAKEFFEIATNYFYPKDLEDIIQYAVEEAKSMNFPKFQNLPENKGYRSNELKDPYSNYISFQQYGTIIDDSLSLLHEELDKINIYYLPANPAKQSALFAIRDKGNALAQAIHDFVQLGIETGTEAYRFIERWMQNDDGFEIGDTFEIIPRAGEAYEVIIESFEAKIPLADKGMGSIQAMLLLFRIACIIHKTEKISYNPLVIIEEPELNLHPALQSKLADLFLEVYEKYGIDFIVETHSEYSIRKSQVIVAEGGYAGELGGNPFSVIYFPKELEDRPYELMYQEDGTLDKNFGVGFFDEASTNTLKLIRIRRSKRNET